ncbi:Por secretion system C-terminal sorting domain-containing protein [Ekhidna lutea]|uniref:Por secretion system C-terminal sorting domain-containing protein n=1 Tax=Ekhidna lutea TaxID=447679 RepID=A0A239I2K4_EKHLU|nr:T9SS type A sorting domain-containing protein [Ekhidna lutea]SNS86594.1 Por secretion system C-terminal sorting domain-containing protein [Ekhidna lutea]
MNKLLAAILIVGIQTAFGQLIIKPINKSTSNERNRITKSNTINPASLPFWDDFSVSGDSPDGLRIWGTDTSSQWNAEASRDVYVNATLAINPPSYKVATFDGLNGNGGFHGADKGLADQLVSDTIDLQGKANVILSFYWQAGGNVEIPDEGDSLILQFYSPNIETNGGWQTVWSKDGGDIEADQDSVFTQVAQVVESQFLTQKFVFRFQSYGDLDGPFDAWHVDWIYLNDNRQNDTFHYLDRGLTGQLKPPFSPYQSLPINQYKLNQPQYSKQTVQAFNLDEQLQPAEYILVVRDLNTGSILDSLEYGNKPILEGNPDPFKLTNKRLIELDSIEFSNFPNLDSLVVLSEVYFESSDDSLLVGNIDLKINDTIRTQYLLHNYYAYDDGTAEYAVGTNVRGGQIAVRYLLEQTDTLTHVDIHFPNIDPHSFNSALELQIFKRLNEEPIRTQPISVINATTLNEFTRYELARPLILSDTFFLGYEQSKNEYIGFGFDRSNPDASQYIFENITGEWEQNSRLQGALMIRPVFSKKDSFVLGANPKELAFRVYPNPTKGLLKIEGVYQSITLMDFSGRVLFNQTQATVHDFSSLKGGLYLLTIHRKEGDQTIKIIKE